MGLWQGVGGVAGGWPGDGRSGDVGLDNQYSLVYNCT